jgi:peptide/nickel transport system permease protein
MKDHPADAPDVAIGRAGPGHRSNRPATGFWLALSFIVLLVILAMAAPFVAPHDPIKQDLNNLLGAPSWSHLLGTDYLGRDMLSRLIWGIRPTFIGTIIALATSSALGIPWGLIAGYLGGALDLVLMRVADALLAFPGIILALALTSVFGASLEASMFSVGIVFSPIQARILRAGVLNLRDREFVSVTRLYGYSEWYRMWHHVLPNALTPTLVQITVFAGLSVLIQTGLNFLGLGIPTPFPSWGASLAETFRYIAIYPEATMAPGLAVVFTVLAIYRIGDELRDRLALEG